jgi:hypothetical protein
MVIGPLMSGQVADAVQIDCTNVVNHPALHPQHVTVAPAARDG